MKLYFIRIYFSGSAVTGFYVPNATDENHALKQIKKMLILRLLYLKQYGNGNMNSGELSQVRVKSFLRSLKKPWREANKKRRDANPSFYAKSEKMVTITEWNMPIYTGAWIGDLISDTYLCNMK